MTLVMLIHVYKYDSDMGWRYERAGLVETSRWSGDNPIHWANDLMEILSLDPENARQKKTFEKLEKTYEEIRGQLGLTDADVNYELRPMSFQIG
jgi:hypothetical protein